MRAGQKNLSLNILTGRRRAPKKPPIHKRVSGWVLGSMTHSGKDQADELLVGDPAADGVTDDATPLASMEADPEELGEDEAIDTEDFEAEVAELDDAEAGLAIVDEELSQKEINARSLAARRAIERRLEQKRLDEDLDYLDLDLDE